MVIAMAATGEQILELARTHVGEKYILGSVAPKNNKNWKGPWDCAEFASWLVFQTANKLYGCTDDNTSPSRADAFTGSWARDAAKFGKKISVQEASRIPGAAVLRHSGDMGHIVISDGKGGTVEAQSRFTGVVRDKLGGRRWDTGVLVPGVKYTSKGSGSPIPGPTVTIFRLTTPMMKGATVKAIQTALKRHDLDPGPIDGEFGPMTAAAVKAFQLMRRLVADGEVGPKTARSLGIKLPSM
jgi:N-acetylmuramoyl-L-alanine amidase